MAFNENTRVKIPAILHLCRLGYEYVSISNAKIDGGTNIFTDIFSKSIKGINPEVNLQDSDIKKLLEEITLILDNEDLGQGLYKRLIDSSGIKLIDFKDFGNNKFNVVTELPYKNGDDEFRPDITLLINGMPLAFVEVKKPNNHEGILAERERINIRFKNKKFRKFINISQVLVFSNNMEYDSESVEPIQGAFYSSTSLKDASFNCFREEENLDLSRILRPEDDDLENFVLRDTNLASIKHSNEFATNKSVNSPTNRVLTSLFCQNRFADLLKYSIAYVNGKDGIEKHIMRYPQFFATKAIEKTLNKGIKKGIIWHTQGSGKTALAFYNVHYLTDYYQKQGIVPKFYFIVDRIDLMTQAKLEFTSRGLVVHTVNSKDELLNDFRQQKVIHNLSGKREITVVNIQKFKDDGDVLKPKDYDINVQRVYFLDEVHRSYNPTGSFLANLFISDRNAIHIGLTGTPLIGKDRKSRDTFGDYIHKYYYNASIADGYTLRLIREGIETNYKIQLEKALKDIAILKGGIQRRELYSHEKFVEPMLDYIVNDFVKSRITYGDDTIGGMVVCDSSEQAKKMSEIFNSKYAGKNIEGKKALNSSLILHDIGDQDERKEEVENFKAGKIDLLFVYNMLLTGFDAKRLKKLYIGRLIKDHNLLQTLTRVNRPYKNFRYGFVVDFADISKEFDATNRAYFEELQQELGDEFKTYSNLFKTKEEIEKEINEIREKLFHYDLNNAEVFSTQISQISDRKQVLEIKKTLENAKNLFNVIRLFGHYEFLEKMDFKKLNDLFNEVSRHLDLLNLKDSVENSTENTNLLNVALENIVFRFHKVSEAELIIADQLKNILQRAREALAGNFDPNDPEFISLYEELKRLFRKKNLDEVTQDEMKQNIKSLESIFSRANDLNRRNDLLKTKYGNDEKYTRTHKRILEKGNITKRESDIHASLLCIKQQTDERVLSNNRLLNNENYFEQLVAQTVIGCLERTHISADSESIKYINKCLVKEYINEYQGNSNDHTRLYNSN
jgi:type I restriction enzyme R subunit